MGGFVTVTGYEPERVPPSADGASCVKRRWGKGFARVAAFGAPDHAWEIDAGGIGGLIRPSRRSPIPAANSSVPNRREAPIWIRRATRIRRKWDREFESAFPQRRVRSRTCEAVGADADKVLREITVGARMPPADSERF